uniref:Putative metalloprotease n=1 Tax=Ixodes ricinus TaxID=34613 RepID=A0A0K8RAV0_IXORI
MQEREFPDLYDTYFMRNLPIKNCEMQCFMPSRLYGYDTHLGLYVKDGTPCNDKGYVGASVTLSEHQGWFRHRRMSGIDCIGTACNRLSKERRICTLVDTQVKRRRVAQLMALVSCRTRLQPVERRQLNSNVNV